MSRTFLTAMDRALIQVSEILQFTQIDDQWLMGWFTLGFTTLLKYLLVYNEKHITTEDHSFLVAELSMNGPNFPYS